MGNLTTPIPHLNKNNLIMKFHFKVTTWGEITAHNEEDEAKLVAALKSGEVNNSNDAFNYIDGDADYTLIDDCEADLSLEANGGEATIEILDDQGNELWNNTQLPSETAPSIRANSLCVALYPYKQITYPSTQGWAVAELQQAIDNKWVDYDGCTVTLTFEGGRLLSE